MEIPDKYDTLPRRHCFLYFFLIARMEVFAARWTHSDLVFSLLPRRARGVSLSRIASFCASMWSHYAPLPKLHSVDEVSVCPHHHMLGATLHRNKYPELFCLYQNNYDPDICRNIAHMGYLKLQQKDDSWQDTFCVLTKQCILYVVAEADVRGKTSYACPFCRSQSRLSLSLFPRSFTRMSVCRCPRQDFVWMPLSSAVLVFAERRLGSSSRSRPPSLPCLCAYVRGQASYGWPFLLPLWFSRTQSRLILSLVPPSFFPISAVCLSKNGFVPKICDCPSRTLVRVASDVRYMGTMAPQGLTSKAAFSRTTHNLYLMRAHSHSENPAVTERSDRSRYWSFRLKACAVIVWMRGACPHFRVEWPRALFRCARTHAALWRGVWFRANELLVWGQACIRAANASWTDSVAHCWSRDIHLKPTFCLFARAIPQAPLCGKGPSRPSSSSGNANPCIRYAAMPCGYHPPAPSLHTCARFPFVVAVCLSHILVCIAALAAFRHRANCSSLILVAASAIMLPLVRPVWTAPWSLTVLSCSLFQNMYGDELYSADHATYRWHVFSAVSPLRVVAIPISPLSCRLGPSCSPLRW